MKGLKLKRLFHSLTTKWWEYDLRSLVGSLILIFLGIQRLHRFGFRFQKLVRVILVRPILWLSGMALEDVLQLMVGLSGPIVVRICMEMNIQEEMSSKVSLETKKRCGYFQPLEYPFFSFCKHCSIISHKSEDYQKKDKPFHNRTQQP